MSKYTTEVRYICEKYAGLDKSVDYLSINEVIQKARAKVFDFEYPIFDETYRSVLESKILKHFYTREIGEETVGLWKLRLEARMQEIMPYYNQRYESELIKFNPLYDTDLATSRNDGYLEHKFDNIKTRTVDGGTDINTLGGLDINTLGGSDINTLGGSDINRLGGTDNVAYDDRDNSKDEQSTERWTNVNSVDWHYDSDTPQSRIADINDTNYATSFTKDVHIQKNDSLSANSDNYEKVENDISHKNHNDTLTTYGKTDTTQYGKTDTTQYGKTDTTQYGKTDTTQYGKTVDHSEGNSYGLQSTDKWLERILGKRNMKSYSEMLNEFRTTFLNIDMEVIDELNDLFFNLW